MAASVLRFLVALAVTLWVAACGGDHASTTTPSPGVSSVAEVRVRALDTTALQEVVFGGPMCETEAIDLLAYAEVTYPTMFSFTSMWLTDLEYEGMKYYARYYPETDNYLAVRSDGGVYALGRDTNYELVHPGMIDDFACAVNKAAFGNKRVVVVHVKYADSNDPFPITHTIARMAKVKAFFADASHGRSVHTYEVKPTWLPLPYSKQYYLELPISSRVTVDALKMIEQFDMATFDIVVLVLEPLADNRTGCAGGRTEFVTSAGIKVLGLAILSGVDFGCVNANITAHEIGHAMGLPTGSVPYHSSMVKCKTWKFGIPRSFTDLAYNDVDCGENTSDGYAGFYSYAYYDFLGSYRGHPNIYRKVRFGWVDLPQVANLQNGGSVTLSPLETTSSEMKGVRVSLGKDQMGDLTAYWVEYRSAGWKDIETESVVGYPFADKVKIWVNLNNATQATLGKDGGSDAITFSQGGVIGNTELGVGETFFDPHRGIKVSRGANQGASATVTVEVSRLQLEPPIGIRVVDESLHTVVFRNSGTAPVTLGTIVLRGRNPERFIIVSEECSGRSLSSGQVCAIIVRGKPRIEGDMAIYAAEISTTTTDTLRKEPVVGLSAQPKV